jgi:hypothetical protein
MQGNIRENIQENIQENIPKKEIITPIYEKIIKINENKLDNPFIKNIKNTKFIKNKFLGLDKNNSFYKKKYEENSANYNSISDNLKDTIDSIKDKEVVSEIKIIKNKNILEGISSDEDEDEIDL